MDKNQRNTLILAGILLFGVGMLAGYLLRGFVSTGQQTEEYTYQSLEQNYNPEDYENFLSRYPDSPHAAEVSQRLEKLKSMLTEWAQIETMGSAGDFMNFKANYDDPRYNRLCDIKIDSLDWVLALRLNTREAYDTYLHKHADGNYAAEASVARDYLKQESLKNDTTNVDYD